MTDNTSISWRDEHRWEESGKLCFREKQSNKQTNLILSGKMIECVGKTYIYNTADVLSASHNIASAVCRTNAALVTQTAPRAPQKHRL